MVGGGRPPFTRLVAGLEAANPFTGPETLERRAGRRFRVRAGANESAFGMSPRAQAAAAAALNRLAWYGDPENHDLRAALAAYHGVDAAQVLVAPASTTCWRCWCGTLTGALSVHVAPVSDFRLGQA